MWNFFEDTQECIPCKLYKYSSPSEFKYYCKANFGVLHKTNTDLKNAKSINRKIRDHLANPLHTWCVQRKKLLDTNRNVEDSENIESGKKLVQNAVFCLLNGKSALDYIKLNSKDAITDSKFPTKNDGSETFFELREIVFEELTDIIKQQFKSVKNASFSLDKVTVRNIPYTVLVTFFFHGGKLRAVLNSIHQMKSNEYDADSTAEMVGKDLMVSLGKTFYTFSMFNVHLVCNIFKLQSSVVNFTSTKQYYMDCI